MSLPIRVTISKPRMQTSKLLLNIYNNHKSSYACSVIRVIHIPTVLVCLLPVRQSLDNFPTFLGWENYLMNTPRGYVHNSEIERIDYLYIHIPPIAYGSLYHAI